MNVKITLKRPQDKESVLHVRMMINGVSLKFYTGKTIQSKNWSAKRQEVLSGEENFNLINDYLIHWTSTLKRIILDAQAKAVTINKLSIQNELDRIYRPEKNPSFDENQVNDFITFIDSYIRPRKHNKREVQKLEQTKKLVMIAFDLISPTRLKKWENMSIKAKSQTILKADTNLPFSEINLSFVARFRDFMYAQKFTRKVKGVPQTLNYKVNYIDKTVKGLKQIIGGAIEKGYVSYFRWTSIKGETRQTDSAYTDFHEIQLLNDTYLTDPIDKLVRDKYVLNCFLGLRYSDLNKLEPHLFRTRTIAGKEFVVYSGRAQKTDQLVEFALHPNAISILESYKYEMPKLPASEFNLRIKKIAQLAGLTRLERIREIRGVETIVLDVPKYELLSSHAGRRSFCTNFYNEGVSIGAIMSVSGHSTEKEFRKYIKKASVRIDVVAEQISAIPVLKPSLRVV